MVATNELYTAGFEYGIIVAPVFYTVVAMIGYLAYNLISDLHYMLLIISNNTADRDYKDHEYEEVCTDTEEDSETEEETEEETCTNDLNESADESEKSEVQDQESDDDFEQVLSTGQVIEHNRKLHAVMQELKERLKNKN